MSHLTPIVLKTMQPTRLRQAQLATNTSQEAKQTATLINISN